jgi:hypothetical protein
MDAASAPATPVAFANSGLFDAYQAYSVGSWPEAVAIGDVNGDGRNDVVMTTSYYFDEKNDYKLFVFLQNSSGILDSPIKYSTHGTYTNRPSTVEIGDVNHDGRNDVVVGNGDSGLDLFLQNPSGGLDTPIVYAGTNANKIKLADLNNDDLLDVVGVGWGTNTASIWLQNSGGSLNSPVTYTVQHGGYDDLDVGDVNNDGLQDVIVMSGQSYAYNNIGVLLQQQDGTLGLPVYYDLGGDVLTQGVAVGDVNSDNRSDIVVSYGGNRPNSGVGAFLQNASGTMDSSVNYASYDCPEAIEISDVNLDGRKDVIVLHGGWNAAGVFLQGETGALLPYELYDIPYASHYNPNGLDVGDINGDGADDIVIADNNQGLVLLYHKQVPHAHLNLTVAGDGNGTVKSDPPGIACGESCTHIFNLGALVTLTAKEAEFSLFSGWSGSCNGLDCVLTMSENKDVTATFNKDMIHRLLIGDPKDPLNRTYYPSLQNAYDNAPDGSTIKVWGTEFTEDLSCGLPMGITLIGGYNSGYVSNDSYTILNGIMTITSGSIAMENFVIK